MLYDQKNDDLDNPNSFDLEILEGSILRYLFQYKYDIPDQNNKELMFW